jgi:hypothetical protein
VHGENEDIDTEAEMLEDVGIEGANMGLWCSLKKKEEGTVYPQYMNIYDLGESIDNMNHHAIALWEINWTLDVLVLHLETLYVATTMTFQAWACKSLRLGWSTIVLYQEVAEIIY